MAEPLPATPESRQIRVFLSSTFRDFIEERDLLVKQVFPRLRKRAQERGVEVVDVDLRWGVTQQESEQGKVIGICLAEIDNCRPYFIGMLGERYGWIPAEDKYPAVVLEQQAWLQQHVGGASVTELEILHGVLNDPKMAGRAFFYFRDPAWSRAQSEPGFVCDTPEEEAKLAALKRRILASDFPVKQGLPDPKAIADQIEADLWALIEEQYPDLEQADALEREARKHASYRQSRLGVYLGQHYVDQLEAMVSGGEQKILITGESGSGKSALIANWMHQHALEHPSDVVYAHHLGCSNDASAIRPLLGRMLDTASKLLKEANLISGPIQVPQDWWELTSKVAETLQDLGRWCRKTSHRWIWVLDGLDRLAEEDQQALPWLPLLIPEGVSVLISALECPVKAIIQERQFQLLEIGPLQRNEQEQLIDSYLGRYTKKLDADRIEQILACELARSPLFLRVLLEELRQCGRFETLEAQIADYIRPNVDGRLAVTDLYERVLERLEHDCGVEVVKQAMTALWASRAGLSEAELLEITGLAPLAWAPIDLALEKAFGRNGNRLVFDHDYLRIAVQDRYLPTEVQQRQGHSVLADWYQDREGWDERDSEELPWQLQQASRLEDLRGWLLKPWVLASLEWHRGSRETINYWLVVQNKQDAELDELIAAAVEKEVEERKEDAERQTWFVDRIANLLDEAGLYRELLLRLRTLSLELAEATDEGDRESLLSSLAWLAGAHHDAGQYDEAERLYLRCLGVQEKLLGRAHPNTLHTVNNIAGLFQDKGDYEQAEAYYTRCLEAREPLLGREHPDTLVAICNLGNLYRVKGDHAQAESRLGQAWQALNRLLGPAHAKTLVSLNNLAVFYHAKGAYEQAEACFISCLEAQEQSRGVEHPDTLATKSNLGSLYGDIGDYKQAEACYKFCLESSERLLGPEHPFTNSIRSNLANLLSDQEHYEESILLRRQDLDVAAKRNGRDAPVTLALIHRLAEDLYWADELEESERLYREALAGRIAALGHDDAATMASRYGLARCLSEQERYGEAIELRRVELDWCRRQGGGTETDILDSIEGLAIDLFETGQINEAEILFRELLRNRLQVLEPSDSGIGQAYFALAKTLQAASKLEEAALFSQQALEHCLVNEDPDSGWTNRNRLVLGHLFQMLGRAAEAIQLLDALQASITSNAEPDDDDRQLLADAAALRAEIEANP